MLNKLIWFEVKLIAVLSLAVILVGGAVIVGKVAWREAASWNWRGREALVIPKWDDIPGFDDESAIRKIEEERADGFISMDTEIKFKKASFLAGGPLWDDQLRRDLDIALAKAIGRAKSRAAMQSASPVKKDPGKGQ